jgi:RNA polymerase sigma factor (sigma-70 family)
MALIRERDRRETRSSRHDPTERDLVGQYLDEISRVPLLDAQQEVDLSCSIEAGLYAEKLLAEGRTTAEATTADLERLVAEGRMAKQRFVTSNLRLVVSVARRYTRSGMPLLDLVQEGNAGLIRAVEKFDYRRGYKFSTYATWWIRQAISRAIAQQARTVRLPVHTGEELTKLVAIKREMTKVLGREPERAELADALGSTEERVAELDRWSREPVSLDLPVGDDAESRFGDFVEDADTPAPEDVVLAGLQRERIEALLGGLDERSAGVLRARFGFEDGHEHTLTEIAGRYGLSRERIRQVEKAALVRLREMARAEGLDNDAA